MMHVFGDAPYREIAIGPGQFRSPAKRERSMRSNVFLNFAQVI
jgi:hypothetical protein